MILLSKTCNTLLNHGEKRKEKKAADTEDDAGLSSSRHPEERLKNAISVFCLFLLIFTV